MLCRRRRNHSDAQRIVLYLEAQGGTATESNRALSRSMGLTYKQFARARTHSRTCADIAWTIAYRAVGASSVLALVDPKGFGRLAPLAERVWPLLLGDQARSMQHESEDSARAILWEDAADDADAKGRPDLAALCRWAAADISSTGRLSARVTSSLAAALAAEREAVPSR